MPIHRKFKNVMHNYTPAEVKVREATSNDPWGPTAQIMNEISELTFNSTLLGEMMGMIWKRLSDGGKNWRHVYKSLVLIDHIIKVGSEKVVQQCRANIGALEILSNFEYVNEEGKDEGALVREKSKNLVALIRDEQRFTHERTQAIQARDRLKKNAGLSMASGQSSMRLPHSKSADRYLFSKLAISGGSRSPVLSEELEAVRPSSHGEEDLQLELALAISKHEHDAQLQQKKGDQLKLQMALEESTKMVEVSEISCQQPQNSSAVDAWGANITDPLGGIPFVSNVGMSNAWSTTLVSTKTTNAGNVAQPFAKTFSDVVAPIQKREQVDPWGQIDDGASKADPWGEVVLSDPWSSSFIPRADMICAQPLVVHNSISDFVDDEFDLLSTRLKPHDSEPLVAPVHPGDLIGGLDPDINEKRKKSAEDFLGENATLVNLTQLLPQPPPQSIMNPFASTTVSSQFSTQQIKQPINKISQPNLNNPNNGITDLNGPSSILYPQQLANQNFSFDGRSSNYMQTLPIFSHPPAINQNGLWPGSTLQPMSFNQQTVNPNQQVFSQLNTYHLKTYLPPSNYVPNNYPSNNNPFL